MMDMNDELDRIIKEISILQVQLASISARMSDMQSSLESLQKQAAMADRVEYPTTEEEKPEPSIVAEPQETVANTCIVEPVTTAYEPEQVVDAPSATADDVQNDGIEELRHFFTINDRYRFRRELFGNNNNEMADTLNVIEAMNNSAEAQDYVYNDLEWDPDNEEVQEFLTVVDRYFNERNVAL
jgi:hypothetical protein